jgi:hypothetical protein
MSADDPADEECDDYMCNHDCKNCRIWLAVQARIEKQRKQLNTKTTQIQIKKRTGEIWGRIFCQTTFRFTSHGEEHIVNLEAIGQILDEARKDFTNPYPKDCTNLKQTIEFWEREIAVIKTAQEDKRVLISWMMSYVILLKAILKWFGTEGVSQT